MPRGNYKYRDKKVIKVGRIWKRMGKEEGEKEENIKEEGKEYLYNPETKESFIARTFLLR